jgi:membrane-associated PAP2 superfamily phosphatase
MKTTRDYRRLWLPDLAGVLTVAALGTVPFWLTRLDLRLAAWFFRPAADGTPAWLHTAFPWLPIYRFGTWPALVLALGAAAWLVLGAVHTRFRRTRLQAAYLLLTMVLGPGLIINGLFKDHWGRPRPRQTIEFGGSWTYQPVLVKGVGGKGKSFPCGHSSMGYYLVTLYFLARRRRALAALGLAAAAGYGTLLGLARMAAGGHYASDVVWSAAITGAVAWWLYYFGLRIPLREDGAEPHPGRRRVPAWAAGAAASAAALLVLAGALLATPVYLEFQHSLPARGDSAAPFDLRLTADGNVVLVVTNLPGQRVVVSGRAHGFGLPGNRVTHALESIPGRDPETLSLRLERRGFYTEFSADALVRVASGRLRRLIAEVRGGELRLVLAPQAAFPDLQIVMRRGRLLVPMAMEPRLRRVSESGGSTRYSTLDERSEPPCASETPRSLP